MPTDYTVDRDMYRDLTESIRRNGQLLTEDEEQAAYLAGWAAQHPQWRTRGSGCGTTAPLILAALVGLGALIVEVMA